MPSPDKYTGPRENFNDMKKQSRIYTSDRKSSFEPIIKLAREKPGVGRYETYNYDEKVLKPPRVNHKMTSDKFNFLDEARFLSSQSPKFHDPVKCDTYKPKTKSYSIRAESEMEKKQIERKWEKNNSPSPVSYTANDERTTKFHSSNFFKLAKSPKKSFIDASIHRTKNVPGVGKYTNSDKGMDYCYRPTMKKKGY